MGCGVSSRTVGPEVSSKAVEMNVGQRSCSTKRHAVVPLPAKLIDSESPQTRSKSERCEGEIRGSSAVEPKSTERHQSRSNLTLAPPTVNDDSINCHQADETGFLYRDVKNIINPKNMIAAVKRGDIETVRALCESNLESETNGINSTGMWNSSPLMIATQYSKMEIAHYLMSRPNLRIDHVNDKGVTALLLACSEGHFDIVTRLLTLGVNNNPGVATSFFNIQTDKCVNASPLSISVMNGHYKCVDALLRSGHKVNTTFPFSIATSAATSSTRMTPMLLACMYGQASVIGVLLSYDADCLLVDSSNSNILHYATKAGSKSSEVFDVLKTGVEEKLLRVLVLSTDVRGYTALHNACLSNQLEVIPILIALGSDVNMRTTPLSGSRCHAEGREESLASSTRSSAAFLIAQPENTPPIQNVSTPKLELLEGTSNRSIVNKMMSENNTNTNSNFNSYRTNSGIPPDVTLDYTVSGRPGIIRTADLGSAECRTPSYDDTESNVRRLSGALQIANIIEGLNTETPRKGKVVTKIKNSVVWGVTPLHIAVKKRSELAVSLLLGKNADPAVKDENDISPLDLASKLRADSPILIILNKAVLTAALSRANTSDSDRTFLCQPTHNIVPESSLNNSIAKYSSRKNGNISENENDTGKAMHDSLSTTTTNSFIQQSGGISDIDRCEIDKHVSGTIQTAVENVARKVK